MAIGSYYGRVLRQAFSETNKKRAAHWWLGVMVGGPGGVAFLAWLRWRRGESTVLEVSPDAFIAGIAGATLAWVVTFAYQLALAPVDLDAAQSKRIAELTPTPLTALQRHRLKVVEDVFGGCGDDALRILSLIASAPLPTDSAKKSEGAVEFDACTIGAFQNGILRVETDNRRNERYFLNGEWKEAVEHFLNERLA